MFQFDDFAVILKIENVLLHNCATGPIIFRMFCDFELMTPKLLYKYCIFNVMTWPPYENITKTLPCNILVLQSFTAVKNDNF